MDRCTLCPGKNLCIGPSGPDRADVVCVGEAPGKDENRKGQVFVGKTGQEVDGHYLPLAGLDRPRVIFVNAIGCMPTSTAGRLDPKRTKDLELLKCCSETHLIPLLKRVKPKVIVAMGNFACKALDPAIDLDLHHGFPVNTKHGIVFVMYHPALGIHEPKRMLHIRTDWIRLRHYLNGTLQYPINPYKDPDYSEVTDIKELNDIDYTIPIACDTESSRSKGPYFLTYSQFPGTARLIRADRVDLLVAFQKILDKWEAEILFHNWLYDIRIVTEMGLRFPDKWIRDTMIMAFHLGNLPQGLKALCFRELGMVMMDFEDLVKPYSQERVLDYYRSAQEIKWPKPEEDAVRGEDGSWKLYKPQSMNTKLKRFFTDFGKNEEKDVFDMWTKNWTESHDMIEAKLGPWPGMDIDHVPFEESADYAMRDSDGTGRLYPLLNRMKKNAMASKPQDRWRECV